MLHRLLLILCASTQFGCSLWVSMTMDGPVGDEKVRSGMRRSEVESILQRGATSEYQHAGMTEARYEYSDGPPQISKLRALLYLGGDVFTLGLSELVFWPIELYASDEIRRTAVATYDRDMQLVSWVVRDLGGDIEITDVPPATAQGAPPGIVVDSSQLPEVATASSEAASAFPETEMLGADLEISLGNAHALVLGIDNYEFFPNLRTAVSDATALATLLRESYGYSVDVLTDATRSEIVSTLSAYRRKVSPGDSLLLFYAGHGVLDDETGSGYWLPVDAMPDDPANWLSNATVRDMLKANPARRVMVIADTCYAGTLARGVKVRTAPRGMQYYKRFEAAKVRTALVSGGLEPVADAKTGNSVFTSALLRALRGNTSVMDGAALHAAIVRPVMLGANQTPEYGDIRLAGHEAGDYLFVRLDDGRDASEPRAAVEAREHAAGREAEAAEDDRREAPHGHTP